MLKKRKGLAVLVSIAVLITMISGITFAVDASDGVWVATTGSDTNPGTEAEPFATIQAAIAAVADGETIHVAAGEYIEIGPIVIDKNMTIEGADKTTTIIRPDADYTDWIQVGVDATDAGATHFTLRNVTLDGAGRNIRVAIRTFGSGIITNNIIRNIRYSLYLGWGIALTYNSPGQNWDITGNDFIDIERVGILTDGQGNQATISNNRFTGNGDGDGVGYGIEVGDGAHAVISGNTITGYREVAASDGSTSAGVYVHSYFGPNPVAEITNNSIQNNTDGIYVGYYSNDTSIVSAHNNDLSNNVSSGVSSTGPDVNATGNWWGDASGPQHSSNFGGTGCPVSDHVVFAPWLLKVVNTSGTLFSTQDSVILEALVTHNDGTLPLAGASVEFFLNGESAGTATTDANGIATLDAGTKPAGLYNVFIEATSAVAGTDATVSTPTSVPALIRVVDFFIDANNLTHAYDDNYNTSANIFSQGGYIVYRLDAIGLAGGMEGLLTLNAADGGLTMVWIEFLDSAFNTFAGNSLNVTGYKRAYRFTTPGNAVFIKIYFIGASALYIYEIEENTNPLPNAPELFVDANNFDDAHDGNINTSANIFSVNGYIIYSLAELGLTAGTQGMITLNAADGSNVTGRIEYLNGSFQPFAGNMFLISGFKNAYTIAIPNGTTYIKIYGIPTPALYIYEIEVNTMPPGPARSVSANNFDDAHDGNINTSANIFALEGYIIYDLADLGLAAGDDAMMTVNAADGGGYALRVEFMNSGLIPFNGTMFPMSGYKKDYVFTLPAGTAYVKIYGIPLAALYIYEIGVNTMPPGPARFVNANNLDHAYDGNINTSGNIFSADGYIIYSMADLGLTAGTDGTIILNAADGSFNVVRLEFLDAAFVPFNGVMLPIEGFKQTYTYAISPGTVYIKIYGLPSSVALYIYEMG